MKTKWQYNSILNEWILWKCDDGYYTDVVCGFKFKEYQFIGIIPHLWKHSLNKTRNE